MKAGAFRFFVSAGGTSRPLKMPFPHLWKLFLKFLAGITPSPTGSVCSQMAPSQQSPLMALVKTESPSHHHPDPSFALPCSIFSLVLITNWHVSYFVSPLHTHTTSLPQRRHKVWPVFLAAVYPQHSQPIEVSQILFVAWKNESLIVSPQPKTYAWRCNGP